MLSRKAMIGILRCHILFDVEALIQSFGFGC